MYNNDTVLYISYSQRLDDSEGQADTAAGYPFSLRYRVLVVLLRARVHHARISIAEREHAPLLWGCWCPWLRPRL